MSTQSRSRSRTPIRNRIRIHARSSALTARSVPAEEFSQLCESLLAFLFV